MTVLQADALAVEGEVRAYIFEGDLEPMTAEELRRFIDSGEAERRAVATSHVRNMVTNIGRQQMTKIIVGETTATVSHIGLSTSATTASLAATALTDEIFRQALSVRASYLTYYQRYVAYYSTTDFNSTGVAGAGLFDTASTGGNMFGIASISLSKSATQSATVDWRIQATT